jgi:hypothetical protein
MEAIAHNLSARRALSRETLIGLVAVTLAIVAMAVDHLIASDPGLDDPLAFVITVGLSLALWAFVFGRVVPRAKADANPGEKAATSGFVCSLLAVFPGVPTLFVGLPFILSAGAIALGLLGRDSRHSRLAWAAVVIGSLVLLLSLGYVVSGGGIED